MFFNQEEKQKHRCYKSISNPVHSYAPQQFTSTRLQAEKDIVQPHTTYANEVLFEPICKENSSILDTKKNLDQKYSSMFSGLRDDDRFSSSLTPNVKLVDSSNARTVKCWPIQGVPSSKTVYSNIPSHQNSILRSDNSTKQWSVQSACNPNDATHKSLPSTNHMMQNAYTRDNVNSCNSSANRVTSLKELEPVGVFWDFENCSVPKGKSAEAVVQKIRRVFFREKREVEFMCVCDTSKEKRSVIEELNKAQVTSKFLYGHSGFTVDFRANALFTVHKPYKW